MSAVNLVFGTVVEPIYAQLAAQGLQLNVSDCEHFQRDADAITRLLMRDLMFDSAAQKSRQKLLEKIAKKVQAIA